MTANQTTLWTISEIDFPNDDSLKIQLRFLIQYAVLAPSSHNIQPWTFTINDNTIRVGVDKSRWLKIADSDQRELYISVGCAIENLLIAAEHFGFTHDLTWFPDSDQPDLVAEITFQPGGSPGDFRPPELFAAITTRHTNHGAYDGRDLSPEHRTRLEDIPVESGVLVRLTDDTAVRQKVDNLTVRADATQFADPDWRRELAHWLGQGVFGTGWITSKMSQLAVAYLNLGKGTAKKDRNLLDSASALGVVTVESPTRTMQLQAGMVFERLFLTAAAMGMALQPMNQILQVGEIREEFEALLPDDWGSPQITFRLGFAEPEDHTPRRPLSDVLS